MLSQLDEQRISLYDERGDILETKSISEMYGRKFYMQERLDELNQLIYDIEHPVEQAQAIADAEKVTDELANDAKWLDTNHDANKYDFTPIPADMPIIDMDNIEEIPL